MKKVLFIDRDGTIIHEPADYQIDSLDKFTFYPEVIFYLAKIAKELDYELVMVTNQDGLGTDIYPEESFWPIQNFLLKTLKNEGIQFSDILMDRSFPIENSLNRKPNTGLLEEKYLNSTDYDLENSFMIGDRMTDMEFAYNFGGKGIFIETHQELGNDELKNERDELEKIIALKTDSWQKIFEFLKLNDRTAEIQRKTNETDIRIKLNLDGTGKSNISTGIAFFDHMLDQLSRHGQMDLEIAGKGDLEVD